MFDATEMLSQLLFITACVLDTRTLYKEIHRCMIQLLIKLDYFNSLRKVFYWFLEKSRLFKVKTYISVQKTSTRF